MEAALPPADAVPAGMKVGGEAFFITNGDPWPFWGFARAIGRAAGYPTEENMVWSMPRGMGLVIGFVSEWWTWIASCGTRKPTVTRHSMRFSCMTRTFNIEKAKTRLGYVARVSMHEGIEKAGRWLREQDAKDKKTI